VQHNGTYPNPVSVLYTDTIEYKITNVNANLTSTGTLVIRDTLPTYLDYAGDKTMTPSSTPSDFTSGKIATGVPQRDTLTWIFDNVPSLDTVTVTFGATPAQGVSASQPMFVNRAWITASDSLHVPTGNSTYHQGADVSIVTFSAPTKSGDIFTGWTGTNGDDPQPSVVIPHGSTGERDYYANYLYSGREAVEAPASLSEDKIWSFEGELYVRTSKPGAIIRIYSTDGMLHKLQTALTAGETRIKLPPGIYIVTLNNGAS
jgi:uncharacterized repeat protein (TIGR02543 family)